MSKGHAHFVVLVGLSLMLSACGNAAPQSGDVPSSFLRPLDYSTTAPPGTRGGPTNTSGVLLTPAWTANASSKGKAPTNEFWSSILFKRNAGNTYSENMFAHPLALHARSGGLELSYPNRSQIGGAPGLEKYEYPYTPDLTLGIAGLNSPDTKTDDFGDWTTTALWNDGARTLRATFGHGLPFVYATKSGGDAQITFVATPTVWANQGNVLGITINGRHYGIFAPAGAAWSVNNTVATSSLAGKDYYSVAVLPDASTTTLNDFRTYAYNFVTGSQVGWTYNPGTATLTTTFNVSTAAKEGNATGTLMALYRHQWMNSSSVNTGYTYVSPRGEMKVVRGSNSFSTTHKFQGVLPYLPDNGTANTLSKTQLAAYVNEANTRATLNPTGDSYWVGKGLGKLAELVPLAAQVGNTAAQNAFLDAIQRVLQDWLDGSGSNLFYYNATWGTLIGYPQGYGSEEELNDHHFHWGYFIKAAAVLQQYRPTWASGTTPQGRTWGASVNDLIMDAANWTTTTSQFPRLRNFDPYAGHSWAAGHSGFAAGNNQESSSEDMNFSSALINWGSVTGNTAVRDLGIFLYTNETAAIEQYWFNQGGGVFPAGFNKPAVGMVWGDGGAYSTWFSAEKEAIQGINLLPIQAGSLYLGRNPAYLKTNYDFLGREPNSWKDIFWSVYAMFDAAGALSKFGSGSYTPEDGETKAHTYQFLHSLNAMGQVDTSVTANVPNYAVFKKGTARTYAAYNPTASPITVTFSDGATLTVPARQVVSSRGSGTTPCSTDAAAPSVPGAVSSAAQTSSSVSLSWGAASDNCGVAAYEVYTNGALKATASGTGTTISGLNTDTAYQFKVRARDAQGNLGPFTAEISVRTQTGDAPTASLPGTVTTSAGAIAAGSSKTFPVTITSAGTYRLSLQSTSSLNSRLINVAFAGSNYDLAADAGKTVIADFPNVASGSGAVVVTARSEGVSIGQISGANLSAPSDPCASDTTAPGTPGSLTAVDRTSSSVTLSWTASSDNCGVSGYEVYLNGALRTTVSGAGTTIGGLSAGTAYTFTVRARDAQGNVSPFTSDLNVTTASAAIPVPGVISTNVGTISNGASRSFDLNVSVAGNLRFLITNASSAASSALTVSFNGRSVPLSIGAGQTIPVDFAGVQAGPRTLSVTANSAGVAVGKLEALAY
ncbi:glycosyl hydrolase [Deinococcus deserti]|uniref:glucan endo-1,3-beta-D-glucosidase n=1 Tax=Deinococcus deserti (strain DSM 17065 / CIP 109153 / LMG 22923 / VCD115) TaxID=546414 RepID=C1D2X3_DEIDV|nr:glycosyl hydrolase [Deinococcus deserti]ACO47762.2 putative glycosyl hydrolase [Deinococcus deserti VCD115]